MALNHDNTNHIYIGNVQCARFHKANASLFIKLSLCCLSVYTYTFC